MTQYKIMLDLYGEPISFQRTSDMELVWNAVQRLTHAVRALLKHRMNANS